MRPNANTINNNIPQEYQDLYKNENPRFQPNQIHQPSLEEIPPEYREMYLREQMRKNEQRPPYQNQKKEINTYIPKQEENPNPNENINMINDNKNKYPLSQEKELIKNREIANKNQNDIPEQYKNIPRPQNQYDNEYINKE